MYKVFILLVTFFCVTIQGIDLYPIPKSILKNIRVSVDYSVFKLTDIDLSNVNGSAKDTMKGFSLGFKWGAPFTGLELIYNSISNDHIQGSTETFITTVIDQSSYKLRYYIPIIEDNASIVSCFASLGQYTSEYVISEYTESSGVTGYLERVQSGLVGDIGIVVGYQLNPNWHLYLSPSYQLTTNDTITNPAGVESSDPMITFKGAFLAFGTSLKI